MNINYSPLEVDFEIPEFLQEDINEMLDYLNAGRDPGLADVYMSTIRSDINACDLDFNDEQADLLRDYYVRGGIFAKNN